MYILLSGKICISKGKHKIGMIEKSGEIFGEMRIIDSKAPSAPISAVGKTVCLAVDTTVDRLSTYTPEEGKQDLPCCSTAFSQSTCAFD